MNFNTCCMDLYACLYCFQYLAQWIYIRVCTNRDTFCMIAYTYLWCFQYLLHGFAYMSVWISIISAWIYIHVCMDFKNIYIYIIHSKIVEHNANLCINPCNQYREQYKYVYKHKTAESRAVPRPHLH